MGGAPAIKTSGFDLAQGVAYNRLEFFSSAIARMKLLVSVSSAEEARAAAEGGADVIDAKNPRMGALGPVTLDVFERIRRTVRGDRLLTAALGDADHSGTVERLARDLVERGAGLVKVGFAGIDDSGYVEDLIARVADVCRSVNAKAGVVAVAYADAVTGATIEGMKLMAIAARAGARGMLVDTANKDGPGLTELWSATELERWVCAVHDSGMVAAVAGKLRVGHLALAHAAGADIAGVRGAACLGGRSGRVSRELVQMLRDQVSEATLSVSGSAQAASG